MKKCAYIFSQAVVQFKKWTFVLMSMLSMFNANGLEGNSLLLDCAVTKFKEATEWSQSEIHMASFRLDDEPLTLYKTCTSS